MIVDGEKLTGTFAFDGETLISHELRVMEENHSIALDQSEALATELLRKEAGAVGLSSIGYRDYILKDIFKAQQ